MKTFTCSWNKLFLKIVKLLVRVNWHHPDYYHNGNDTDSDNNAK